MDRAAAGESSRLDVQIRVGEGRLIWLDFSIHPLRDAAGKVVFLVPSASVIEKRKQAEIALEDSRRQLRELLARLQRSREEERVRVSREIHDELGQLLTGLKMDVRWLERKLSEPGLPPTFNPLLERAVAATEMADATLATVRKIAAELRPGMLHQLGLESALGQELRRFEERSGIRCRLDVTGVVPVLAQDVASELFYIGQEALTNVARHAQATEVRLGLRAEGGMVELTVTDDGVGMAELESTVTQSLGLVGMRERAAMCGGTVDFSREEPSGTRVTVRIPLGPGAGPEISPTNRPD